MPEVLEYVYLFYMYIGDRRNGVGSKDILDALCTLLCLKEVCSSCSPLGRMICTPRGTYPDTSRFLSSSNSGSVQFPTPEKDHLFPHCGRALYFLFCCGFFDFIQQLLFSLALSPPCTPSQIFLPDLHLFSLIPLTHAHTAIHTLIFPIHLPHQPNSVCPS